MAPGDHEREGSTEFAARLANAVRRSAFDRFAFAVLLTMVAAALHAIIVPLGLRDVPPAIYLLVVFGVALLAGFAPATISALLGMVLDLVIQHSWFGEKTFSIADVIASAGRLGMALAIAWLMEAILRRQRQSDVRVTTLEAAAQEFQSSTLALQATVNQLSGREASVRSTLECLPDALLMVDGGGVIRGSSAAAERLFGWSVREMIGQPFESLLSDGKRSDYAGRRQKLLDSTQPARPIQWFGLYGRHVEGRVFPVAIALSEASSEDGRRFIYLVRDESGRKGSIERFAQVQAKIAHMTRLAALNEMGVTLAHQLNQPLAAISNYVNAARRLGASIEGPGASESRAALIRASEQALRAGVIISHAREAVVGGLGDRTPESLKDLVEEAIGVALLVENEADIDISVAIDLEHDAVMVDRILVQHVVVSVIRNALAGMTNCPRREIAISTAPGEDGMVRINVADPGTYIPTGALLHAFYPFVAVESSETGIGLSVVRSIVQSHGGEVFATSNHTGGSTFTFTLPRA